MEKKKEENERKAKKFNIFDFPQVFYCRILLTQLEQGTSSFIIIETLREAKHKISWIIHGKVVCMHINMKSSLEDVIRHLWHKRSGVEKQAEKSKRRKWNCFHRWFSLSRIYDELWDMNEILQIESSLWYVQSWFHLNTLSTISLI